jgi:hypothetical protein
MKAICCEIGRGLGEKFVAATRLYAEAVMVLTSHHANVSWNEYIRLRTAVEQAQKRSEALGIAYDEHLESHRRRRGRPRIGPSEATLKGRPGSDRDPYVN